MTKRARTCFWKGLLVLFAFFLGLPGVAEGSPGQIRMEVDPGFGGVMKGEWVPVRVRLANSGSDVEGELIVKPFHLRNRSFAGERVKLAGGTSKEVTLLLSRELALPVAEIEFRTGGGVAVRKKLGGTVAGTEMLIGVLSDSPELSSRLRSWLGVSAGHSEIRVEGLRAEEIPNRDLGLSGLDVLVINGIDVGSLGKSRQRAIRRWVEKGGLLVVAGSSSASSSGELEPILPVKGEGTTTLKNLKPFRRWGNVPEPKSPLTVGRVRLADGGRAVISAGDLPLLARRPAGAGAVISAAYDLTASPLAEWSGNERLWREMLFLGGGEGRSFRLEGVPRSGNASLEKALMKMPHLELPSLSAMAALFLVYALGVGPILFWILKTLNRREWAWWIIPSLGIAATLGIYAYGKILRGDEVLVHNLAYVETKASGEAEVRGVSAFWSQEAGTYRLDGKSNLWLWPFPEQGENRLGAGVSGRSAVTFLDVPYWTPRGMSAESTASLGGDLRAVARFRDGTWHWEVKNGTRLFLRDVSLVLGDDVRRVGSLAPGETRTFKAEDVSRDAQGEIQDLSKPELKQQMKQRMKQQWKQTREDLMQSHVTGYCVTGWTEEPIFSYGIRGRETKEEHLSMVLGRVEIEPVKKENTILWNRGTLPSQYVEGDRLLSSTKDSALKDHSNPVMIAYDLPFAPADWKPLRIDVFPEKRRYVEVYDWNRGRWVEAKRLSRLSPDELPHFVSPFNRIVILTDRPGAGPLLEVEGRVVR